MYHIERGFKVGSQQNLPTFVSTSNIYLFTWHHGGQGILLTLLMYSNQSFFSVFCLDTMVYIPPTLIYDIDQHICALVDTIDDFFI